MRSVARVADGAEPGGGAGALTVQLLPEEEAVVIKAIETALREMDGNGAPADRQGRPKRTRRPLLRRTTTDTPKKTSARRSTRSARLARRLAIPASAASPHFKA